MIEPYNPPIHPSDSKPAGPSWSLASPDLQITCPEGRLRSNQARQTCGSPSPWLVSRFVRFLSRLPRQPVSCGRAVLCCARGRVSDREASRGIRISSSQHESTAGAYIDSEILARNWRRSAHPYIEWCNRRRKTHRINEVEGSSEKASGQGEWRFLASSSSAPFVFVSGKRLRRRV
ncbi:hypothetical protein GQ55_5G495200 [Panicum hallii var. hallii]|uniref:Uncharacterized protein n=1 Tax=Panicum hallii var. hallii TaxID=1504633 RepID=A0A2T7DRQ8_9POAL|nr:hypothetical protein GQ55_5G495200 [Panicum hallii var. hallii]